MISYGSKGYLVQSSYGYSAAFDPDGNKTQEFKGSGNHFGNFLDAVVAGDPSLLNSDALCGHLSAGLSHIGNISYYLGEKNKVSVAELKEQVKQIKSLDDNVATLDRIVEKTEAYGVDLKRTPFSIGPVVEVRSRNGNVPGQRRRRRHGYPGIPISLRGAEAGRRVIRSASPSQITECSTVEGQAGPHASCIGRESRAPNGSPASFALPQSSGANLCNLQSLRRIN